MDDDEALRSEGVAVHVLDPSEYITSVSGQGTWNPTGICGEVTIRTSEQRHFHCQGNKPMLFSSDFLYAAPPANEIVKLQFGVGTCSGVHSLELNFSTPPTANDTPASAQVCCICFDGGEGDDSVLNACRSLACGHLTCDTCLKMHVRSQLESWGRARMCCPGVGCKEELALDLIGQLFPENPGLISRLEEMRAAAIVQAHPRARVCPEPRCGHTVFLQEEFDTNVARDVRCSNGHCFCLGCGFAKGHGPLDCRYHERWSVLTAGSGEVDTAERASENFIRENTQNCPLCRASIQRNGGCNHMICRLCGKHFCYVCGGDWALHGTEYYNCRFTLNQDRPQGDAETRWRDDCMFEYQRQLGRCARLPGVGRRVDELNAYFDLGLPATFASELAGVVAEARWVMSRCYAAKFYLRGRWPDSLQSGTGALESLTETLEASLLSSAAESLPPTIDDQPAEEIWKDRNAANAAMDVEVAATRTEQLLQLQRVVQVQTQRMRSEAAREFRLQIDLEEKERTPLPTSRRPAAGGGPGCSIL